MKRSIQKEKSFEMKWCNFTKKDFWLLATNFEISEFESKPYCICNQQVLLLYVSTYICTLLFKCVIHKNLSKSYPIFVVLSIVTIQKIFDFSFYVFYVLYSIYVNMHLILDPSHKNFITHTTEFTVQLMLLLRT